MNHSWLSGLFLAAVTVVTPSTGLSTRVMCTGFLPDNNMKIPVSVFQVGGITQAQFNEVLDLVENHFRPIMATKGANLRVNRRWSDDTVNASAEQQGRNWILNMYGGLARHPVMTKDGFLMVACHEAGHHLGGAPKVSGWFGQNWASNEGEADYYASLRCMRALFTDDDNAKFVQENAIDPVARLECERTFQTQAEENLCMREAMAGLVGGLIFQALRQEPNPPRFDTPDPRVVSRMDDDHPATQCRLDTYYQGALCVHDTNTELSDTNPNVGSCTLANGQNLGLRPRCWFKP